MASSAVVGVKRPASPSGPGAPAAKARAPSQSIATGRIIKEFQHIKNQGIEAEVGMTFSIPDESNCMVWEVVWKYELDALQASETHLRIQEQLRERGMEGVRLGMIFPEDYPGNAPFVYLKGPHIYCPIVFGGGGFCAETLSANFGWTPVMRAYMLQVSLRALVENYSRVELDFSVKEHSEKSARTNQERIFDIHKKGWGSRVAES